MRKFKVLYGLAFWCMSLFLMTGCEKLEEVSDQDFSDDPTEETSFFEMTHEEGDEDEMDLDLEDLDCFEFSYPLTLQMPDGTEVTIDSDEEFEEVASDWFDENPDCVAYPTFVFPITVIIDDEEETINNEEELCELIEDCWEDESWDDFEDCFTFEFPLNVLMPGGDISVANNIDELEQIYEDFYDAHEDCDDEPEIQYPFTVTLEDGTQVRVTNEEEFEEVLDNCDC